jgi:hypothetical protein
MEALHGMIGGEKHMAKRVLPAPQRLGHVVTGMARHHIIPHSLLLAVWNSLRDQFIKTDIPEARVAIYQYLILCGLEPGQSGDLLAQIRLEHPRPARPGNRQPKPLSNVDEDILSGLVMWPAWNVVVGPRNRSDEPQQSEIDLFKTGLIGEEPIRMKAAKSLHSQLTLFVKLPPSPAALRTLSHALVIERSRLGRCAQPIPFRPAMWVREADGKWRKANQSDEQP